MRALMTRLNRFGLPALAGAALALALALVTGLNTLNFGLLGAGGSASSESAVVDKGMVSDGRLDVGAPTTVPTATFSLTAFCSFGSIAGLSRSFAFGIFSVSRTRSSTLRRL